MLTRRRGSLLLALSTALGMASLAGAGCAKRAGESSAPRVDRTVISREQMLNGRYVNVYDAVAALRSMWLRPRTVDSFNNPSQVWVYIDDTRLGEVETLRRLQPSQIATVRFYDGPSATGRWGVGHGAGVIHVSTWSSGALGFPGTERVRPDTTVRRDSTARPDSAATPRRP